MDQSELKTQNWFCHSQNQSVVLTKKKQTEFLKVNGASISIEVGMNTT